MSIHAYATRLQVEQIDMRMVQITVRMFIQQFISIAHVFVQ